MTTSLQSRRELSERVLGVFLVKFIAAIFDFYGIRGLGREENFLPRAVGDSQKEEERRKWGNKNNFTPFPVPSPTVHSNSKSNMAGRINDRKFVVLTRPSGKLSVQAKWFLQVEYN